VNAIYPGWIPTVMSGSTGPDEMDVQTNLIFDTIEKLGNEETGK
jgi:hypothetical protein